jgi:hypothetical protein
MVRGVQVGANRSLYTVNYTPAVNGGWPMWLAASYNGAQYQDDMQTAAALGFNTIRCFIPASVTGAGSGIAVGVFAFPFPDSTDLDNLVDFYNRSKTAGVKLHLNLFDGERAFGQIAGSQTWVTAILGALPDFDNIACIEIKNELPAGRTKAYVGGFDSGWPPGTTEYSTVGPVAIVWAQQMIPYIQGLAPGVPLTVSTTGGVTNITPLFEALNGTDAQPAWYEWHCYVTSNVSNNQRSITQASAVAYSALSQVIAVVGDPAMLAIGEFGANTTLGGIPGGVPCLPTDCGESQVQQFQLNYIQGVRWACWQLGLGEPSPWILFDEEPSAQFTDGQTFGLYTTAGEPKLSAKFYQQVPPGSSAIPGVSMNGNMIGTPQQDAAGNSLPPQWTLYCGQANGQPITADVDTVNTYQGNPSTLLTGSAGTLSTDNSPALETGSAACWPLITGQEGNTYTFTVAMKATGDYGSPRIQLSWYDFEFGRSPYLGATRSPVLTLTDEWQTFSVSGKAPAGADFVRVLILAGHNAGSIWVAGAALTGPAPRS